MIDVERMSAALYETWKYWDEAGEAGRDYVLSPDHLKGFAADLCREYESSSGDTLKEIQGGSND